MGYRLRAEWQPCSRVLIAWPHADTDWRPWLDELDLFYCELAARILPRARLLIVCRDAGHRRHVLDLLTRQRLPLQRIELFPVRCDDTWVRDYGPLSLEDDHGRRRLLDFRFNGWGGKYPSERDDGISAALARLGAFDPVPMGFSDLVLEGGALETDGAGTLLATRRSVVDRHRNPGLDQAAIEARLSRELGLVRFHWLDHGGLSGDDTDGHIDTLARFADPGTLVYVTARPGDPDALGLERMARELAGLRQRDGRPYRLSPLPAPAPVHDADGRRLPASYANFLILGDAVLAPVYGDPADGRACAVLASCFPGREIVPIDCRPLIRQNGSLHCATMQIA
ncbi:MAG TPA: agmatine deiminase family protein [Sedimenticola thiotaurini]|uniref:Agmatine deiminase family protein n=1 Tax=Sedimenticola thiotaurini TaxID=1543721 RepID=A0A831RN50_9GAMM|nr:agmatine deiminase family protein [Sedimenticola thiotaurini]